MDKEYLTKITNDLYRLTLLFPKKEPLRYKMRELADNVLTNLILIIEGNEQNYKEHVHEIKKNIEPLDVFFEIAKDQNWVSPDIVSETQDKFAVIKQEIEEFGKNLETTNLPHQKQSLSERKIAVSPASFNLRQRKIIEILEKKDKVQVGEIQETFPRVTKRTLRRDFDSLVRTGVVQRKGKANLTFYHLADKEI
jgi:hypothetical protein